MIAHKAAMIYVERVKKGKGTGTDKIFLEAMPFFPLLFPSSTPPPPPTPSPSPSVRQYFSPDLFLVNRSSTVTKLFTVNYSEGYHV